MAPIQLAPKPIILRLLTPHHKLMRLLLEVTLPLINLLQRTRTKAQATLLYLLVPMILQPTTASLMGIQLKLPILLQALMKRLITRLQPMTLSLQILQFPKATVLTQQMDRHTPILLRIKISLILLV